MFLWKDVQISCSMHLYPFDPRYGQKGSLPKSRDSKTANSPVTQGNSLQPWNSESAVWASRSMLAGWVRAGGGVLRSRFEMGQGYPCVGLPPQPVLNLGGEGFNNTKLPQAGGSCDFWSDPIWNGRPQVIQFMLWLNRRKQSHTTLFRGTIVHCPSSLALER